MSEVFVIAEVGVNHNGAPDLAFQLVDAAVDAGADAVKFQTFKAEKIASHSAVKARYQQETSAVEETQYSMLKKLELSHQTHQDLLLYCQEKGIQFLSTAFDSESLNFLVTELKLKVLKISSGEITNGPLLLEHARTGCDLILSTGMATLEEVEQALGVIAFGLMHPRDSEVAPSRDLFAKAFSSELGHKFLKEKVTLLHCTTEYPAPLEEINLRAMLALSETFGLKCGYSDHSQGVTVPIAAVALGAPLIEKHFTLDKTLPGPDHKASLEPIELKEMISSIRATELCLGTSKKEPTPSEKGNLIVARKSLVAAKEIRKGEIFTVDNLAIKRPGSGASPMEYWEALGKASQRDYQADEVLN